MTRVPHLTGWFVAALFAVSNPHARAQGASDDPYVYGLRTAIFPAAFVAGVSQSHFGSAGRAEIDVGRRIVVQVSGRAAWADVAGQDEPGMFALRAGLILHLSDRRETTRLAGTVYPEDTPAVGGAGPGTDRDLDVPVSQKLGGPRLRAPDQEDVEATLRKVQSLRLGYDFARAVERGRPDADNGSSRYFANSVHAAYLGYGWGEHWNLSAAAAGGAPQVGWRRFYLDALVTLPGLVKAKSLTVVKSLATVQSSEPELFAFGGRIGMEGAIDALLRSAPGIGFAYTLELGALPGKSGVEGYLFVGLGLALDLPTHDRERSR
jgi:hypothetical protein